MQILRTCCICGKVFYASQSSQAYCSKECKSKADNRRYYDKIRKNPKIETTKDGRLAYSDQLQFVRTKDYLSVTEAAILVGISRPTMYKLIKEKHIPIMKLSRKTLIFREDLNEIKFKADYKDFLPAIKAAKDSTKPMSIDPKKKSKWEYIVDVTNHRSLADSAAAHNIGVPQMRSIAKKQNFKVYRYQGKLYLSIDEVEAFFKKNYQTPGSDEVTEWYSIDDIQRIYGLRPSQILRLSRINKIPKKRMGRIMLYAKQSFDATRGIDAVDHSIWISFNEVMEQYGLTHKQAMGYAYKRNFKKMRVLRCIYTLREDWQNWYKSKVNESNNPGLEPSTA